MRHILILPNECYTENITKIDADIFIKAIQSRYPNDIVNSPYIFTNIRLMNDTLDEILTHHLFFATHILTFVDNNTFNDFGINLDKIFYDSGLLSQDYEIFHNQSSLKVRTNIIRFYLSLEDVIILQNNFKLQLYKINKSIPKSGKYFNSNFYLSENRM